MFQSDVPLQFTAFSAYFYYLFLFILILIFNQTTKILEI